MRIVYVTLVAFVLWTSSAHAATIVVDWTGTVLRGVDARGLFGSVGADLTGLKVEARYVFDTDVSFSFCTEYACGLAGGAAVFNDSHDIQHQPSPGRASMKVNGVSYELDGISGAAISASEAGGSLSTFASQGYGTATYELMHMNMYVPGSSPSMFKSFSYSDTCPSTYECGSQISLGSTWAVVDTDSIDVFVSSQWELRPDPLATPEPDTWALLLLGFGLVGGAMRWRQQA